MVTDMPLKYENLEIRRATQSDAPTLMAWWNDGGVMAHAGFPNGLNITLDEVIAGLNPGSLIIMENGHPIGECCYRAAEPGTAEIGIKICVGDCQNRGIGKKVLSMLITYLFQSGYDKIALSTNPDNLRARHVYRALGFREVRINADSWTDQLGRLQSSVDCELIKGDFHSYAT